MASQVSERAEGLSDRSPGVAWGSCTDMDNPTKVKILAAAKAELCRHSWTTFIDEPPTVSEGGKGVVVPGCPPCKKRINTETQYMRHLADDVLPVILRKAFALASET
jgi:hypothetical protein